MFETPVETDMELVTRIEAAYDIIQNTSGISGYLIWKATGSYGTYSIPGKTAALDPEFAVENLPFTELQSRFLRLQWNACPWEGPAFDRTAA